MSEVLVRPSIETFEDPVSFVEAMLAYRKKAERGFSILQATSQLRRVSPALVSLVIARKRALTPDRADEFAKLLGLTAAEKHFFKSWVAGVSGAAVAAPLKSAAASVSNRREVTTHILKDWLNVYVKDMFQFASVQRDPSLAEKMLLHIASPKRVRASIEFLMREGHLRRTLDGRVVLETSLAVADPKVPSQKIRAFHKAALGIAAKAIDRVPPTERMANTMIVPLNEKAYREAVGLIEEFAEKLKDLAANRSDTLEAGDGEALYQLIVNLAPAGGKLK